jgi:uncharacterized membrane protein
MAEMKDLGKTTVGMDANLAAALSYVFGWVSGLIFFLIEKENKFLRFHAMQSMLFSAAGQLILIILGATLVGAFLVIPVGLVFLVLWIVLIIKSFSGEMFKLPVIGDMAEKYSVK